MAVLVVFISSNTKQMIAEIIIRESSVANWIGRYEYIEGEMKERGRPYYE